MHEVYFLYLIEFVQNINVSVKISYVKYSFRINHVSEKNDKYYNDSFYTPFRIIIPNCLLSMQHKYTHFWKYKWQSLNHAMKYIHQTRFNVTNYVMLHHYIIWWYVIHNILKTVGWVLN